jgi:hypothetical protein
MCGSQPKFGTFGGIWGCLIGSELPEKFNNKKVEASESIDPQVLEPISKVDLTMVTFGRVLNLDALICGELVA